MQETSVVTSRRSAKFGILYPLLWLILISPMACERSGEASNLRRQFLVTFSVRGFVKENPAPYSDGLFLQNDTEAPTSVQFLTYDSGDPDPVATATLSIDVDGAFSGIITEGDTYRANVLDAAGESTGTSRLTAFGTDSTGMVAAFPTAIVGTTVDYQMYTFAAKSELLALDGTIDPDPGEEAIAKLLYGWIQTGRIVTLEEIAVTPLGNGDVLVDIDVPVYDTGCGYAFLLMRDATGAPVEGSWTGTSSTPTTTYTSDPMKGGFVFAQCGGGFDKVKWCKKIVGDTLYAKKLGEAKTSHDTNLWCLDCPKDEAPTAGADVPTDKVRIKPPQDVYCSGTGITAGNGKVFVSCQERMNVPHDGLAERRRKAEAEAGEQPDEDLPTRTTGVTYMFSVFEATSDTTGKEVHDLKWYQTVKATVSYKSPSGDGSVEQTGGEYKWDDGSLGGGTATSDHSYPHQKPGRSTAGASQKDWQGMSDTPAVMVPTTDAEAKKLACDLGITGDAKGDWTELTVTWNIHTILVCCATDEILAVYSWSVTVTIKKAGAGSYTSSATASGVTHDGNDPPAEWPEEFPC